MDSDKEAKEFEAKVAAQLLENRPYDTFQFAQGFLARRFSPATAGAVRDLLLAAVRLFAQLNFALQGGHLLMWYLDQDAYWKDLSKESLSGFMDTIAAMLDEGEASQSGVLAEVVHEKMMQLIQTDMRKGAGGQVGEAAAARAVLSLGDALCRVGKWEQSVPLFVNAKDMQKVALALHQWAQAGPRNEYPLYFTRMVLTLLSKKRLADATALIQNAAGYLKDFESQAPAQKTQFQCSISAYHFSVMLCDLLGMASSISAKEKIDIYALLHKKYKPVLEYPDAQLLGLSDKVSATYGLQRVLAAAKNAPPGGGGGLFEKMLRKK
jgi:hypothetical protein